MADWTDAQIQAHFLADFDDRFHAENAAWRACELRQISEIVKRQGFVPDWFEMQDSFLFDLYKECSISWLSLNYAQILCPTLRAIDRRFLDVIETMELHWGMPSFHAVIVEGEPRVTIDCHLVDGWSDDRHEAWMAAHYDIAMKKLWADCDAQ